MDFIYQVLLQIVKPGPLEEVCGIAQFTSLETFMKRWGIHTIAVFEVTQVARISFQAQLILYVSAASSRNQKDPPRRSEARKGFLRVREEFFAVFVASRFQKICALPASVILLHTSAPLPFAALPPRRAGAAHR